MGLTIHYSLKLAGRDMTKARQIVAELRQHALDLPFQEVGPVVEFVGDACDFQKVERHDPSRWLLIQAQHDLEHKGSYYSVPPKRVVAFSTWPGDGCEQANFGLCLFPGFIEVGGRRLRTGARGWMWRSFCKTQYASRTSTEHFLRCHLCVVRMLDHAKALGVLADVNDEGDYWQRRDLKALAQEVGEWNEMIAAGAGRLKDLIGPDGKLETPILAHPEFEHLEAKGRRSGWNEFLKTGVTKDDID